MRCCINDADVFNGFHQTPNVLNLLANIIKEEDAYELYFTQDKK